MLRTPDTISTLRDVLAPFNTLMEVLIFLVFGLATVTAPWLVMQPAMGLGFAALKTPAPLKNCARSLTNHAVFGAGLYLAAAAVQQIGR